MFNPIIFEHEELEKLNINGPLKRGTLVEIHIADIHFGVINPKVQYDILKEQFLDKIRTIHFDVLSIDGDLFDHKFMSNSDPVMYASLFINEITNICREKNATLVIIHGTYFHDAGQLKLFYHYLKDPTLDIRIVEEVRFEYIKGAKILCIPELYGKGSDYYNYFLWDSGDYDGVFMHGAIKGSIYAEEGVNSSLDSTKAPIFTIDDFGLCKGPIMSGHVHVSGCYNKHFYHIGNPIRDKFGEEQPKGFMVLLHNLDTGGYYVHLEEITSFRYDTINLDSMLTSDPKDVISYIDNLKASGIDNIRLEITEEPDNIIKGNIDILTKYYSNSNSVKIKCKDFKKEQIRQEAQDFMKENEQYSFILDKELNNYEILSKYINLKKGYVYISADELKQLILEEI